MTSRTPELPANLTLLEAVGYLKQAHGIIVSRQTIYNWASRGRQGVVLKTIMPKRALGTKLTTKGWVDDFLSYIGE